MMESAQGRCEKRSPSAERCATRSRRTTRLPL